MFLPIKYNRAQTIGDFALITAAGTAFQTTWTPASGESTISIDQGAYGNLGSDPTHEGKGRWSQALTAAESKGLWINLNYSDGTTDIEDQGIVCFTGFTHQLDLNIVIPVLEVNAGTFTPTATIFESTMISPSETEHTTADAFNGRKVVFTSGALLYQMGNIDDYVLANSISKFTIATNDLTTAPSATDTFVVV